MAGRSYERLDIEVFGRHLLSSGDLDPVYCALVKLDWPAEQVHRWLIAYWCYYHCGAASYMSGFEGNNFWEVMMVAARNEAQAPDGGRWPRGHERRHFRGQQGMKAVADLTAKYGNNPETMVARIVDACAERPIPYTRVAEAVRVHRGFGPWISFKVADMIDRVLGVEVDFDAAAVFMFKDPVKAALMLWRSAQRLPETAKPKNQTAAIETVVDHLTKEFSGFRAPPLFDRPVNIQEVETVLCKWKSHMNGHYPLNNDIDEINDGLVGWGERAEEFAAAMPHGEIQCEE